MKVHWVSNETPDKMGQGGQRRQYFQIQALRRAGHRVVVFSLDGPQDHTSVAELTEVVRIPPLEVRGRLPIPWRHRGLRHRLADGADVVVVAHAESWLRFASALPRDVPTVVDMHNIFSRWNNPRAASSRKRWECVERDIRGRADLVSVTSGREARAMPEGRAPVIVVENGVDPQEWSREPVPSAAPVLKLFGNWSWAPNAEGLAWFADRIWPEVWRATGATCEIAGAGVERAMDHPGLVPVGRVEDLQEFLSSAWAVAVPLPESVGAPVKYAEALAVGVPVIATDQACPGRRDLPHISDDPHEWIRVLSDWLDPSVPPRALDVRERAERLDALSWDTQSEPLVTWIGQQQRAER